MAKTWPNPDDLKMTHWKPTFNSQYMGWVDNVSPELELIKKPIQVGSMGPAILGHWIVGLTGVIKIDFRETHLELFQRLAFGWTSGAIPLCPPVTTDDYTYAKLLNLHPGHLGADVFTDDLNLLKCAPGKPFCISRDGNTPDVYRAELVPYPDRSKFASVGLVYGWIGAVPT